MEFSLSPGIVAANDSDCFAADGSAVCRRLLPVDPFPTLLSAGRSSPEGKKTHMSGRFLVSKQEH